MLIMCFVSHGYDDDTDHDTDHDNDNDTDDANDDDTDDGTDDGGAGTFILSKLSGRKFVYPNSAPGLDLWPEQRIRHPIKKLLFTMQNSL